MALDWGKPNVPSYAPEIASIGNMLTAFAENRWKMQQAEAARAAQAAQFEEEKRRNAALETQANARFLEDGRQFDQTFQQTGAKHAQDAATKRAEAFGNLTEKYEKPDGISQEAYMANLRAHGFDVPQQAEQPRAPAPVAGPVSGGPMGLEPPPVSNPMDSTFMGQEPQPQPGPMPPVSAGVFGYSLDAPKKAREARIKETTESLNAYANAPGGSKYRARAMQTIMPLVPQLGGEEAAKRLIAQQDRMEGEAAQNARTAMMARSQERAREEKPLSEFQGKTVVLAGSMMRELDKIAPLPMVSDSALTTYQNNRALMEGAAKTGTGLAGAYVASKARENNIIPKSPYQGLSDQDQIYINSMENAAEKGARILTGTGMPETEAVRIAWQGLPSAGESDAMKAMKISRYGDFIADAVAAAGPRAEAAIQEARTRRPTTSVRSPGGSDALSKIRALKAGGRQ